VNPDVSVVVPVRDRANLVPTLLAALDAQELPSDRFEVLVVDDGSRDSTPEIVEAWARRDPGRRALIRGEGRGPGYARNLGVRQSRARWIAFTDSDTAPDANWLARGIEAAERLKAVALEGAVEPWPPEAIGPHTHQVANSRGGLYMTANMLYRRELLDRLGGFDERFSSEFLEDSDLAFRVMEAGYEIPFVPEFRVRHHVHSPGVLDLLRSTRHQRWLALFAVKHPDRYWRDLRPAVRPLSSVDVDVLLGLLAMAASGRSRGVSRAVLLVLAANGLKRGFGAHQVFRARGREVGSRAALAVGLPMGRALWWIEGCIRFRKFVW
jgi:glycosyltransferase involved in cell wall biosynthesis